jgi:hypothetical protein
MEQSIDFVSSEKFAGRPYITNTVSMLRKKPTKGAKPFNRYRRWRLRLSATE